MNDDLNGMNTLHELKQRFPSNIQISYININSIRNKCSDLKLLIDNTFDKITIAETKLDESFPSSKFKLPGYQFPLFRHACTSNSGGLLTFVKEGIPAFKLSNFAFHPSIQVVPIELKLRKEKLLLFDICRPD